MNEITNQKYFLEPGHLYASKDPSLIMTVLGTSVAVSIWNRKERFGGLAHFVKSKAPAKELSTQYGDVAIMELLRQMKELGSRKVDLCAQIFGGATLQKGLLSDSGKKNIKCARKILKKYQVKILSEDIAGNIGRKVVFNTLTNEAITAKVEQIRDSDWSK